MPLLPTLTYGTNAAGTPIALELGKILNYSKKAVYSDDGVRFLYNHVDIEVQAVVNAVVSQPVAMAVPVPPDPRSNPPPGFNIVTALRELERLLMRPRQKLRLYLGGTLLLESPQRTAAGAELTVDANVGPCPIRFAIKEVLSPNTVIVTFRIETWISETLRNPDGGAVPTIISHQYEQSEDIGEDYRSRRTIEGTVVFRADLLAFRRVPRGPLAVLIGGASLPLTPDMMRAAVFHPIPNGYQRVSINVRETSDKTTLKYQVTDEQAPWGIHPGHGILRCSATQRVGWSWPGMFNPSVFKSMHIEVEGYPTTTNAQLVWALGRIFSTMTNLAGERMVDRRGAPGTDRNPFGSAEVTVHSPERRASLEADQRFTGNVGRLLFAATPNLLDPAEYHDNFGTGGGPGVVVHPAPYLGGSSSNLMVLLLTQALEHPDAQPTLPFSVPLQRNPNVTP